MAGIATQELWIGNGELVPRPVGPKYEKLSDRQLLQKHELVKIEIAPNGTTIKWVMFAANWTSLYFAVQWIGPFMGPFTINFFNSGWFEESYDDVGDVRIRIGSLISKSDIRFSSKTYTKSFDPQEKKMPPLLNSMWEAGCIEDSKAVHCAIDTERHLTQVEHVGADSALAKVWGISPVTYPCLSGHSYDRIVSECYYEVVKTGRPVYDHVLAAMVHPGGEVRWFGYHRLVFLHPLKAGNLPQVTIASVVAKVDIPLL